MRRKHPRAAIGLAEDMLANRSLSN